VAYRQRRGNKIAMRHARPAAQRRDPAADSPIAGGARCHGRGEGMGMSPISATCPHHHAAQPGQQLWAPSAPWSRRPPRAMCRPPREATRNSK